ncbi:hypothetical protein FA13DRAFT_1789204 [Coprinellus micaceus]|uniref:Uncharacterized protein n=1 Tax=Coprinellus micaceus TaxID=71717 RepID=A0A4Y7TIK7_COPMI|nr:hypothetical protein FA13DRAFT_1789204 [Coprinellus micaceus]
MPAIRTLRALRAARALHRGEPRTESGPAPTGVTAHFLRQIEAAHVRTPSQGRPVPLQFCYITQGLSEWAWPCNPNSEMRIPPCDLESFRRTNRFRAPSCLCAFIEGTVYTESRIGIVETVTDDTFRNQSVLNGEYVATCAKQRCGYFLCLERFYPINHLRLQVCAPRKNLRPTEELANICDIDKSLRSGDGLFQLMTDVVVRGSGRRLERVHPNDAKRANEKLMREIAAGMSEDRFWSTFVQCFLCKTVTLRKNFATSHECKTASNRARLAQPSFPADEPETPSPLGYHGWQLEDGLSSPTPTEPVDFDEEDDVFGEIEYVLVGGEGSNSTPALGQAVSRYHNDRSPGFGTASSTLVQDSGIPEQALLIAKRHDIGVLWVD